jgi:predicted phosphodiesterase
VVKEKGFFRGRALSATVAALVTATACTDIGEREPNQAQRVREGEQEKREKQRAVRRDKQERAQPSQRQQSDRQLARAKIPGETFRFAVVGDFGEGNRAERRVANAIEDWVEDTGAEALVTTGDNIYPDGDPKYFEEAWREPYGWVKEEGVEIAASLGNHDVEGGEAEEVMDLLEIPRPWYRERVGDVELFVLDGNRVGDPRQTQWLRDALQGSDGGWQIAVSHQPAFSCSKHGSTPGVVREWVPLFEKNGVDLVLNGHDHSYQRFVSEGVTYVVTGGGGAELYGLRACDDGHPDRIEGEDEEHHFVGVFGSSKVLRVAAIDEDGDVIDIATLRR